METAIDKYAADLLSNSGLQGIRITLSKGTVNDWHAYVNFMGTDASRKLETGRHANFMDALMELEELMAESVERSANKTTS